MGMWLFETSDEKHIELTQLQHSNFVVDCNPAGAHLHSSPQFLEGATVSRRG
jgi:hypothetical protein